MCEKVLTTVNPNLAKSLSLSLICSHAKAKADWKLFPPEGEGKNCCLADHDDSREQQN